MGYNVDMAQWIGLDSPCGFLVFWPRGSDFRVTVEDSSDLGFQAWDPKCLGSIIPIAHFTPQKAVGVACTFGAETPLIAVQHSLPDWMLPLVDCSAHHYLVHEVILGPSVWA